MAAYPASDSFVVIVDFQCEPDQLEDSLGLLARYVGSFLNRHEGFIESFLQHDDSGSIVHVARWQSEADFRAFADAAQHHPDLAELRLLKPKARFLKGFEHFLPSSGST